VVFSVIAEHGYDGLVLATFMAGLILLIAGYLRIGNLVAYVPEAVVNGFTIGIALIIATSQIRDFMGLSIEKVPADFLEEIPVIWRALDGINVAAFLVALVTMALIILFRRLAPKLPGLIVAVGIGSALVMLAHLPVDTIGSRFGELPNRLPMPHLPSLSVSRIAELFPSALVIAFLAGVESLLSAVVADRMMGGKHPPECRGDRAGCRQYRFVAVRRSAGHRRDRPHGDECQGRGQDTCGGRGACAGYSAGNAGGRATGRLSGHAGAGGAAGADGMEHERVA
jgi:SulP family sulfate permease